MLIIMTVAMTVVKIRNILSPSTQLLYVRKTMDLIFKLLVSEYNIVHVFAKCNAYSPRIEVYSIEGGRRGNPMTRGNPVEGNLPKLVV